MKKLRNKNMCNLVKRIYILVLTKRLNYKYVKDFKYGQTKTAYEAQVSHSSDIKICNILYFSFCSRKRTCRYTI